MYRSPWTFSQVRVPEIVDGTWIKKEEVKIQLHKGMGPLFRDHR